FTPAKKVEFRDGAIADIRKAIQSAPTDPNSWLWRRMGAVLVGTKFSLDTVQPEVGKPLAAEARKWINDAIDMAGKRQDLANSMSNLQRVQGELEKILTAKGFPQS